MNLANRNGLRTVSASSVGTIPVHLMNNLMPALHRFIQAGEVSIKVLWNEADHYNAMTQLFRVVDVHMVNVRLYGLAYDVVYEEAAVRNKLAQ